MKELNTDWIEYDRLQSRYQRHLRRLDEPRLLTRYGKYNDVLDEYKKIMEPRKTMYDEFMEKL